MYHDHPENVFYGTDDGAQDGSFSEFAEFKAHYESVAPARRENIHMISLVGGLASGCHIPTISCGKAIIIMSRKRITVSENPATLLLPQEILDKMGVVDGDEVDVSVVDRTLILMPLDEVERAQKLGTVTKSVLERRKRAYQELAKGAE